MTPRRRALLAALLLAPAVWHIASVAWIMAARAAFPADIEWLESSLLYVAYRFDHGMAIYGRPPGFLAMSHPPLSYVTIAGLGRLIGLDYLTGRLVSIFWTVVAAATLARQVWLASPRRDRAVFDTVLAVGWFAAAFVICGTVYDLARDDAMGNALVLLAAACVARGELTARRVALCGLLIVAAMYTRITTAPECTWIVACTFVRSRRAGVALAAIAGSIGLGILGVLQAATHGAFYAHTVGVLGGHSVSLRAGLGAVASLLLFAPQTVLLAIVLARPRLRRALSPAGAFWAGLTFVALPPSVLPFAKIGGWYNDWVPFVTIAWPTAIIVAQDVLRDGGPVRNPARWRRALTVAASLLLVTRVTDPRRWIPSAHAWSEARQLGALVRSLDGGVAMPSHPFFAVRNGSEPEQIMAAPYVDLAWAGRDCPVAEAIRRLPVRWVLVDQQEHADAAEWYAGAFAEVDRPVPAVPPLTGAPLYPVQLARRREPAAPP